MRQDIADLIRAVHQSADSGSHLDVEDKHLLNHMYREIKRSGATLQNEEARNRLKEVKAEIDQLQLAAVKTLTDGDTGGLWFSGDELLGMSPKVLDSLDMRKATPKNGAEVSEYFTTFKDSVRSQMASSVRHAGARRTYAVGARRRFPENASRLAKLVVLRDEMARILGFDNYADMRMEELMAGNIGDVLDTLRRMVEKLKPLADAENDMLLDLKHQENSDEQDKQFTCIDDWDWAFYAKKFRAQNQNGGAEAVKEYFEVHHTWNGTLTLFEELFRIRFKDITGSTSVWHDSVKTYSVWNDPSKDEGSFLGYLYVDLFEREGKYQNQRHVLIEPSFVTSDGARNHPSSALLCSFRAPTDSEAAMLDLFDVRTLFHELGHCIHNIVSTTKYAIPHSRDYIEIPSVLLENWGWEPTVLSRLARHHRRHQEGAVECGMPAEVLSSILQNRGCFGANNMMPMLQRAIFDLTIHSPRTREEALGMDTTRIWNTTRRDIAHQSADEEDWGWEEAAFGHLFRKYSAGFFAYATANAYAADIFSSHFAGDAMNPARMDLWRRLVLELGSGVEEGQILENFMGRPLDVEILIEEVSRVDSHKGRVAVCE
ncbi:hypothetical protein NLG97_g6773 [Lecanicillium saksenae]|uniref:Uncharacterized protein n=1 Tax=Lecanicillium saksenae TaxID=468837 RepID=A0ACC1QNQ3_9HYPO|nr:hypothetical protein NLG97_g6773 [Lecanicillium saksenae]